jgi:L-threonylcarbamoyladenylate synthase
MEIISERNVVLEELADSLREGKVLVLPTDTVYGLVCDATNKKAVERLFKIKNRDINNPIPAFVRDMEMAREYVLMDKEQEEFLNKVWPGKVTVVLKRSGKELYGAEKDTLALRVPKHKLINDLLEIIEFPVSGTSANVSGKGSVINVKDLLEQLEERPDIIVDGGELEENKASTIIDLTQKPIKTLRQ